MILSQTVSSGGGDGGLVTCFAYRRNVVHIAYLVAGGGGKPGSTPIGYFGGASNLVLEHYPRRSLDRRCTIYTNNRPFPQVF